MHPWLVALLFRATGRRFPKISLTFANRGDEVQWAGDGGTPAESVLIDRTHGTWRGMQTDYLSRIEVRDLPLRGSDSTDPPIRLISRDLPGAVEGGT